MKYIYKNSLGNNEPIATIYKSSCDPTLNHIDYHPHYEIYFCRNAIPQKFFFNGKEYFFDKPIVTLTMPYTTHSILSTETSKNNDTQQPFERFIIYFDKSLLESMDKRIIPSKLYKSTSTILFEPNENAVNTLSQIFTIAFFNETNSQEKIGLLIFLLNYLFQDKNITNKTVCAESSEVITNILKYIDANISQELNADKIASQFFISRAKLDRDFRKYVGNTFHNIVEECKLSTAIKYLQQTTLPISEISRLCGFNNEYYFYSFFKKLTGTTPSKFRRL